MFKKSVSLTIALCLLLSVLVVSALSATSDDGRYISLNPYEKINWDEVNAYRAQFHAHTWRSDGHSPSADVIKDYYDKGFDILGLADHDVLCSGDWTQIPDSAWSGNLINTAPGRPASSGIIDIPLTPEEKASILDGTGGPFNVLNRGPATSGLNVAFTGTRQQSNGMIPIPNINEQTNGSTHIVTMWTDFVQSGPVHPNRHEHDRSILAEVERQGGIAFLPHRGRHTGGLNRDNWEAGAAASNNPETVARYAQVFLDFERTLGMEIFNRLDNETLSDRILWDNILTQTMPYGRNVFAFSTDDAHRVQSQGFSWNVMLLPELTAEATKSALENGEFFAVTRVARREGVNTGAFIWGYGNGGQQSQPLLYQTNIPEVTEISVSQDGSVITITGNSYHTVEWIADGVVIYSGNSLDLNTHSDSINYYVRAQLFSDHGALMTNAFGVGTGAPRNPVESLPSVNSYPESAEPPVESPVNSIEPPVYSTPADSTEPPTESELVSSTEPPANSEPTDSTKPPVESAAQPESESPTSNAATSGQGVGAGAAGGGKQPNTGVLTPVAALLTLTVGSGAVLLARKKRTK